MAASRPFFHAREAPIDTARRSYSLLALFLFLVAAVASFGAIFSPGPWYAALQKPGWTPPDWLFPPVWTLLYIGVAVAGWLLWSAPGTRPARIGWCLQLLLNGLWSWLFFGLHQPLLALVDIALLLAVAVFVAWSCVRHAPTASLLFAPYIAWVGYAATLNAGVWWLNR